MPPRGGERDRDRQPGRKRPGAAGPIRKRGCYFCKEKVEEIDYKNANQLRRYISEKGKIRSRRITDGVMRHLAVRRIEGGSPGPPPEPEPERAPEAESVPEPAYAEANTSSQEE